MLLYGSPNHSGGSVVDLALFTTIIAVGSLVSVYELENSNKRIFLLHLRDEIRTAELQRANNQLLTLSLRDALTGVGNRRSFDLALEQAWSVATQNQREIGLLMVDADSFKAYNDTLGHGAGDRCLQVIAQTLQGNIRGGEDQVARYGGEEFAVLLPNTSLTLAEGVAERMRQAVEQLQIPHPAAKKGRFVTVSIGVAILRPTARDSSPLALVQAADDALYEAKHAGRNRVTISAINQSRPQLSVSPTLH
jgi:diguanylate cyclase (GGDEF)-like protein